MATVIEQLEAMRHVPDNWDGYGGAAPRQEVVDSAIVFLRHLAGPGPLPEPFVTPTRRGGVLLAWEQGPHQLEVEFEDTRQGSFVYLNRDTGETATGTVVPPRTNGKTSFALAALLSAFPVAAGA